MHKMESTAIALKVLLSRKENASETEFEWNKKQQRQNKRERKKNTEPNNARPYYFTIYTHSNNKRGFSARIPSYAYAI